MRFSAVTALCAAPLALAGSLQSDLAARGLVDRQGVEVQVEQGAAGLAAAAAAGISVETSQGVSATEIIVIWVNNGGTAATQTINSVSSVAGVTAATHSVIVGGTAGGLTYTPPSVFAAIGDMVVFSFESQNHTVTQSAFAQPCVKLASGMDSGFMANINNTVSPAPAMAMQVTVATPLWFYCRQTGHCGKGMTFSINPQNATTGNKTQAAFQALAIAQNGTGTAATIAGGTSVAPAASVTVSSATVVASSAAAGATMASGTGTVSNGACDCSCLCGTAAFPNAAVQGVANFGGMAGAMPMSAIESV